ncbi:MAG: helix-turn-helix domain-containing protein [Candidatus Woesearchaeota archaeon]
MVDCEMCGKKNAKIKAKVEGTTMTVCLECSKFGDVVHKSRKKNNVSSTNSFYKKEQNEERVITNISQEIKRLRQEKNITPEELAKKVNEKESIILKIESGSFQPSIKLANKLGKFFQKRFVNKETDQTHQLSEEQKDQKKSNQRHEPLTMGDLLSKAMKKK